MRKTFIVAGLFAAALVAQETQPAISFEVTSVKPSGTEGRTQSVFPLGPGDVYVTNGGRFNATGFPLVTYVFFAYKILGNDSDGVRNQLPGWATTDLYDIEARTDGDPRKDTKDQMRMMMRSLLSDRFKMKTHYETREVSVFAAGLAKAGKTGPQLQAHSQSEAESPCTTVLTPGTTQVGGETVKGGYPTQCGGLLGMAPSAPGRVRVGARNITMDFLAKQLTGLGNLGRPVLDQSGLSGTVDFVLEWVPDALSANLPTGPDFTPDPNGPSFQQAVKDQLGLKLDSQKGSTQVLIIDHVERPGGN